MKLIRQTKEKRARNARNKIKFRKNKWQKHLTYILLHTMVDTLLKMFVVFFARRWKFGRNYMK